MQSAQRIMLSLTGNTALSSSGDMPMLDSDFGNTPPLPSSNTLVAPLKLHRKEQPTSQAALLFLQDPKSGLFGTMPEDDVPIRPQARRHRGLPPRNRARPSSRSQVSLGNVVLSKSIID